MSAPGTDISLGKLPVGTTERKRLKIRSVCVRERGDYRCNVTAESI